MKAGFLEKLIERLGRIGPEEVQNYFLRLAQEKGFLETVFNAVQEGIIVTDSKGRITYLNDAACDLFGIDANDTIGKRLDERVRGLDWESLTQSGGPVSRDMEIFYPANRFINFYIVPLMIEHRETGERIDKKPASLTEAERFLNGQRDQVGHARSRCGTRDWQPAELAAHPFAINGAQSARPERQREKGASGID
jgi:PAS domain-containing protein